MGVKAYDSLRDEYPSIPIVTPRPARRNRPLTEHEKVANRFIARYRIVVEHTIGRMRRFQALIQVDRHHRRGHTERVRAVAGLVNRVLDHQAAA